MMSGRALGHTGGTLDKLESRSGKASAPISTAEEFTKQLSEHGLALPSGQRVYLAPADRKLYARCATSRVPSNLIPLIASTSIMSKKLAEGVDALVLDVKVGGGAVREEAGGRAASGPPHGRHRPADG